MKEHNHIFRIIIVDDNADDIDLLGEAVKEVNLPLEIVPFTDGAQAFDYLRQGHSADLVIADVNMPLISGIELLNKISKDPTLSQVQLALTSGSSQGKLPASITDGASFPYLCKSPDWSGYLRLAREIYDCLLSRGHDSGKTANAKPLVSLMRRSST